MNVLVVDYDGAEGFESIKALHKALAKTEEITAPEFNAGLAYAAEYDSIGLAPDYMVMDCVDRLRTLLKRAGIPATVRKRVRNFAVYTDNEANSLRIQRQLALLFDDETSLLA